MAVLDPVIVEGLRVAVSPVELVVDRLTVPANPFRPVIVMVAVPDCPALNATGVGRAAIVKSTTSTVTTTE